MGLYPSEQQVSATPLIAATGWIPGDPVRIENVALEWAPGPQAVRVDGSEPETRAIRPLRIPGQQYERYTSAIRYLDPPSLFENRPSYRLMDVSWSGVGGQMVFGLANYFDKLDVSEAVGHELAAVHRQRAERGTDSTAVDWAELPFRSLVREAFDPHRRAVIPAITTLTLRRRRTHGTAAFLLHWRDPAKVATATGMYDVIPAGEFQPSSMAPWDQENDFDLWRNIVRELSEELLGTPEHDGSRSAPIDYPGWPFYRALEQARERGPVTGTGDLDTKAHPRVRAHGSDDRHMPVTGRDLGERLIAWATPPEIWSEDRPSLRRMSAYAHRGAFWAALVLRRQERKGNKFNGGGKASKWMPKVIVILMITAGACVAGVLGTVLNNVVTWLASRVADASTWAFGAAVPALLLIGIAIPVVLDLRPSDTSMGKATWIFGFMLFPVGLIAGQSFAPVFDTGQGVFGGAGGAISTLISSVGG